MNTGFKISAEIKHTKLNYQHLKKSFNLSIFNNIMMIIKHVITKLLNYRILILNRKNLYLKTKEKSLLQNMTWFMLGLILGKNIKGTSWKQVATSPIKNSCNYIIQKCFRKRYSKSWAKFQSAHFIASVRY